MYNPTEQDLVLLQQRIKNPYIQLIICDKNDIYNQLDVIDSVVINDSYNIDVTSDIRRTYNLTLSVDKTYDILEVQKRIWINRIIYIKYGIHNVVTNKIKWYPFGYFTFTDFTYSVTETDYTLQINCIDLVGLYNGTVGGNLAGLTILIPNGENVLNVCEEYKGKTFKDITAPINVPQLDNNTGKYNMSPWRQFLEKYYNSSDFKDGYYWNSEYLNLVTKLDNNNNYATSEDLFWDNKIHHVLKDFLMQNGIPEDRLNIQENNDWNVNYDLEFNTNTTIWDIVTSLNSMYNTQAYFDNNGIFVFEESPESKDINNNNNINLHSTDINNLIISETIQQNTTNIKNIVQIFGQTFEANGGSYNLTQWDPSNYTPSFYQIPSSFDPATCNQFVMNTGSSGIFIGASNIIIGNDLNTIYKLYYYDEKGRQKTTTDILPQEKLYYCKLRGKNLDVYNISGFYTITKISHLTIGSYSDQLGFNAGTTSISINNQENFCLYLNTTSNLSFLDNDYKLIRIGQSNCYYSFYDSDSVGPNYGFQQWNANCFSNGYYHLLNLQSNTRYSPGQFRGIYYNNIKNNQTNYKLTIGTFSISNEQNVKLCTNTSVKLETEKIYQIQLPQDTNGVYVKVKNGQFPITKDGGMFKDSNVPYLFKFTGKELEYVGEYQVYCTTILTSNANNRLSQDKEEEGDFHINYVEISNNPYTVEKIGKHRQIFTDGHYGNLSTSDSAYENCIYELWHNSHITNQITLNTIMIPWLQGNEIVDYVSQKNNIQKYYVIKQVQGSVSSWTQTITMQEFESFHPPNEWFQKN